MKQRKNVMLSASEIDSGHKRSKELGYSFSEYIGRLIIVDKNNKILNNERSK